MLVERHDKLILDSSEVNKLTDPVLDLPDFFAKTKIELSKLMEDKKVAKAI